MKAIIFSVNPKVRGEPATGRILGPYRVAHILREQGWDAEVVDFITFWKLEELQEFFKSRVSPDLKFIGFGKLFDVWHENIEIFLAWVKQEYPHIKVLCGSQYLSNFDSSNFVDYYISGFSEYALLELLKYLFSNGRAPSFSLKSNSKRKIIEANSFYPANDVASLKVSYQDRDFLNPGEWLPIEISRGCKFACSFCDFPFLNVKGDPSRSQKDFEEQLKENYDRFGISRYTVSDSTFNDSTEKISKFADVVERLDFDVWFGGFIRADLLISRPRDREELLRMNFLSQFYGIESMNHQSAKAIGKGMHPDKIKEGLLSVKDYFQKNGSKRYIGQISLIVGLPHETIDSQQATFDWLEKYWMPMPFTVAPMMILESDAKQSEISADYKKFGYRPITENNLNRSDIEKLDSLMRDFGKYLLWENDHLDIIKAASLSKKFLDKNNPKTQLAVWNMSNLYFHKLTIDQLTTITYEESSGLVDEDAEEKELIDNYIRNKLNSE
jgi:hypothetical protein